MYAGQMKWLVTGGLGYIGSHLVNLIKMTSDDEVVVIDNLSEGSIERNIHKVSFEKVDITDASSTNQLFESHKFDGVFHLAAKKSVAESALQPEDYYETNVRGTELLLQQSRKNQVKHFVFASTCAVYGTPKSNELYVNEQDMPSPTNVYGSTKLDAEQLVKTFSDDMDVCIFRFFNVFGSGHKEMMDIGSGSIVSNLIHSAMSRSTFEIFGNDYNTRDGTCLRDYIDVRDVSLAMLTAMNLLENGHPLSMVYNLGTERGVTVLEMVNEFSKQLKVSIDYKYSERRVGDVPSILSDTSKVRREIGFQTRYTLAMSLESIIQFLTK